MRLGPAVARARHRFAWITALVMAMPGATPGKADELALRVAELVRQLDDENRQLRDKAEQRLRSLGPTILEHLPPPDGPGISAEQRLRLRRLYPQLFQAELEASVKGAVVAIGPGPVTLLDAVALVQKQTGNRVTDLRQQFNQEPANPLITIRGGDRLSFWETMDKIAEQAGVSWYPFTEDRSLGVMGRPAVVKPVCYAGAFRFAVDRLVTQRDFAAGQPEPMCFVVLEVLSEPRLRPMLVEVDTKKITATDDQGRRLVFAEPETFPVKPDQKTCQFSVTLRMAAPMRNASRIAELAGELGVWFPAQVTTFQFARLEKGRSYQQTRAGVRVEVRTLQDDGEGIWTVPLVIEQLLEPVQVESFLQASLEPELFLRKQSDQTRFDQNSGVKILLQEPGRSETEYEFADAPGKLEDYELLVSLPTGMSRVPMRFSFRNLHLP